MAAPDIQTQRFDPQRYWEQRLDAHPDITGVGYLGRSPQFVEQQYRSRRREVERALRHHALATLEGRSVLDIGAGTGIWLDFWHRHGARHVAGLDFAQPSVERLRASFPDDLIVQADLSAATLPLEADQRFDLISAFDVLLHIVDPGGFGRAIANLARHCVPGGWLVISDPIVCGDRYVPAYAYAEHNTVRSLAEYRATLEANGFAIASIWPATVLLSNPLEASSRLAFLALAANWKATGLWGRSNALSALLGPGFGWLDHRACRRLDGDAAPCAKIILARKTA